MAAREVARRRRSLAGRSIAPTRCSRRAHHLVGVRSLREGVIGSPARPPRRATTDSPVGVPGVVVVVARGRFSGRVGGSTRGGGVGLCCCRLRGSRVDEEEASTVLDENLKEIGINCT